MAKKPILARIRAVNLKGRHLDVAPSALTLLIGENATGKTAVREAIVLALMGRHPEFGKQGKSILRLAGTGPSLSCKVELTDGRCFESTWKRRGGSAGRNLGEQRIELLDAQLDFDTFRQAKPTARQEILEGLLGQDDEALDSRERERARDLLAERDLNVPLQEAEDWLSALQEDCSERALNAKHEAHIEGDALLELMSRPAPENAPSPEQLDEAEKRFERATREEAQAALKLGTLNERIRSAPERPAGQPPDRTALDELDGRIENLEARDDESASIEADWQRLSVRIETLRERRGDGLAVEHDSAALGDPPTEEELREANESERDAQRKVISLSEQLVQDEKNCQQEQDRLENLLDERRCPTCGAEGENLAVAVRSEIQKRNDRQAIERERLENSRREAEVAVHECQVRLDRLKMSVERSGEATRWTIDREIESLQTQIDALADPREARAGLATKRTQLRASRRELRDQLERWDAWRGAAPPDELEVENARVAHREAEELHKAAREARGELKHRADAVAAARVDRRHEERLKVEKEKHDRDNKAYREVSAWAKERKRERAANRMAKLLQPANGILAGLQLGELAIEGTTIGIKPDGGQPEDALRPLEVLSSSETTVVATAIQVAIASQAELRLVVVDDLNHLTSTRKATFLSNLRGAVDAGIIDQVIALDHDEHLEPEGWTRFDVEDVVKPMLPEGAC
ncbi:MAG: hypothetical protein IH884_10565 [Myxococcales bacterium]|nr:hypothetical protein [Myxococcales bacterium]